MLTRPGPARDRGPGTRPVGAGPAPGTGPDHGTGPDPGTTLVELLVAMMITGVVLAAGGTCVAILASATARLRDRTAAFDRGRLVVDDLDRDLRWVDAVNRPVTVSTSTYLEYRSVPQDSTATCTQWRYSADTGVLAVRSWPEAAPSAAAPHWQQVLSGVVNTAAQPVFSLTPAGGAQLRQQVTVDLQVRATQGGAETRATLTARNTSVGTVTNPDTDGDGRSAVEVCTAFGRP